MSKYQKAGQYKVLSKGVNILIYRLGQEKWTNKILRDRRCTKYWLIEICWQEHLKTKI